MTKREKILALWDGGLRDKREIRRLAESTLSTVACVLSTAGRTSGRMENGPPAKLWPGIQKLWEEGERDLSRIAAAVGSASAASVRAALNKHGHSVGAARRPSRGLSRSGYVCRVPKLMVDHARERGLSPAKLAQRILDIVAADEMYVAVLDEEAEV